MTLNEFLLGGGLALLVSGFTEVSSWVTKKLTGSPLDGFAAFFTTVLFSGIGGAVYFAYTSLPSNYLLAMSAAGGTIFLGASFVFQVLIKNVPALHVVPDTTATK